jgi:hypothetical protein
VTAFKPASKDALDLIIKAEAIIEMALTFNKKDIKEIVSISKGKTTYFKLFITLIIIFSSLAISFNSFNASIIGNLSLIFSVLYLDLLITIYSRLLNAFIISIIVSMLRFKYISNRLRRKSNAMFTTLILVLSIALSAISNRKDKLSIF